MEILNDFNDDFPLSLPSCVVNSVKQHFPSDTYTGYLEVSPVFHTRKKFKIGNKK
jgi:hypothetical protein